MDEARATVVLLGSALALVARARAAAERRAPRPQTARRRPSFDVRDKWPSIDLLKASLLRGRSSLGETREEDSVALRRAVRKLHELSEIIAQSPLSAREAERLSLVLAHLRHAHKLDTVMLEEQVREDHVNVDGQLAQFMPHAPTIAFMRGASSRHLVPAADEGRQQWSGSSSSVRADTLNNGRRGSGVSLSSRASIALLSRPSSLTTRVGNGGLSSGCRQVGHPSSPVLSPAQRERMSSGSSISGTPPVSSVASPLAKSARDATSRLSQLSCTPSVGSPPHGIMARLAAPLDADTFPHTSRHSHASSSRGWPSVDCSSATSHDAAQAPPGTLETSWGSAATIGECSADAEKSTVARCDSRGSGWRGELGPPCGTCCLDNSHDVDEPVALASSGSAPCSASSPNAEAEVLRLKLPSRQTFSESVSSDESTRPNSELKNGKSVSPLSKGAAGFTRSSSRSTLLPSATRRSSSSDMESVSPTSTEQQRCDDLQAGALESLKPVGTASVQSTTTGCAGGGETEAFQTSAELSSSSGPVVSGGASGQSKSISRSRATGGDLGIDDPTGESCKEAMEMPQSAVARIGQGLEAADELNGERRDLQTGSDDEACVNSSATACSASETRKASFDESGAKLFISPTSASCAPSPSFAPTIDLRSCAGESRADTIPPSSASTTLSAAATPPLDDRLRPWALGSPGVSRSGSENSLSSQGERGARSTLSATPPLAGITHSKSMEVFMSVLLNPLTRPSLTNAVESRVLMLLEEGPTTWNFDMVELDQLTGGHALSALGWALLERHAIRQSLGISAKSLQVQAPGLKYCAMAGHELPCTCAFNLQPPEANGTFLALVEEGYQDVPYHNSVHAACVTHGLHWLLTCSDCLRGVAPTPLDMLAALIAAIVHDLGHDGCNNGFHCAADDELAIRYAYSSVLERHHLATAFRMLHKSGLLASLPVESRRMLRETLVEMVLATDFEKHASILAEFTALTSDAMPYTITPSLSRSSARHSGPSGLSPTQEAAPMEELSIFSRSRHQATEDRPLFCSRRRWASSDLPTATLQEIEKERMLILKVALKVADLGNVSKGKKYCLAFTECVMQEFFHQGDREKALGLPLTPGYDRETANVASSQLAFYKYIVAPLYTAFDELVPVDPLLRNLAEMRTHWEGVLRAQESLKAQQSSSAKYTNTSGGEDTKGAAQADYVSAGGLNAVEAGGRRRAEQLSMVECDDKHQYDGQPL